MLLSGHTNLMTRERLETTHNVHALAEDEDPDGTLRDRQLGATVRLLRRATGLQREEASRRGTNDDIARRQEPDNLGGDLYRRPSRNDVSQGEGCSFNSGGTIRRH